WQWVVGYDDGVSSVSSDVPIARDDNGDRLTRVTNRVHRDCTMLGRRKWCADGHWPQELGDLLAGEYRFDAVHGGRCAGIDRADRSVRDIAAFERQVLHADERDVVDIGAASLDEARIFATLDALAYELGQYGSSRHCITSFRSRRAEWR